MKENKLAKIFKEGKASVGTRIMSTWPTIIEMIGQTGLFDYVEFAGEYSPYDLADLDNMARAAELYNISMMIKVDQSIERFLAQRALGSGIQNILFTDIRSLEDAKHCVKSVRAETPESGGTNPCCVRRNYMPGNYGTPEYEEAMNQAVVGLMVEKDPAMSELEDILSVEGVDMVQFGPCDYAMSIGMPGKTNHERVLEAEERMIKLAKENDVVPRAEIGSPEEARRYLDLGVKHFSLNTDIFILRDWLTENGDDLRRIISNG